jgi:Type IV secretion-system coupling protein DNA-binding domain/TraM recognition site of TraD and TraG
LALPIPQPVPAPSVPSGPLAHYLAHPGATSGQILARLGHVAAHVGPTSGAVGVGAAMAGVVATCAIRRHQGAHMAEHARLVVVRTPPDVDPQGAATLWTNLVALLRPPWRRLLGAQPHLGFELVARDGGLTIALWVPGSVPPGLVERAVEAAWPGSRTETCEAVAPLPLGMAATGGELHLALLEHYPLRTEHKVDPFRPLLGALLGLEEDQAACVQILARPLTGRRLSRLRRAAVARRNGQPANRTARLLDLFTPGKSTRGDAIDPTRSTDVADIVDKAAQPAWAVVVRYALCSADRDADAPARLRGRAHAVASAFAIYSGRNRFTRRRLRRPLETLAARRFGRGNLLSVGELAAIAHLPVDASVPGLERAGANAVAPPPAVANSGSAPGLGIITGLDVPKVLGDAQAGGRRPVALAVADGRYHLHVMGATGSGKSTLLTNLVLGDVEAGRGVVVIDPKGDLITDLCDRLPDGAVSRTVLIDPEDTEAAPVLNVLAGEDPDLVVDNLVGIFRSIFAAFWGPRTDDVLRAACLTLLRYASATGTSTSLAEVPRLLADEKFRAPRVAMVVTDKVGLGGFWDAYEAMSEANRTQVIGPLMNKLRAFLMRDFVRQIVGRPDSSFDMGHVLDGGVCLVRVPKGILGEETARLLGSFVVAKVWQSATHRARLGQAARVDASLVVDECQNFLHLPRSFDEMLAEARGYRLSMVLAHQHLGQLPKDLREAVSANARTKVWFSMSPEDAHVLGRHVTPEISEHDLSHLGAYTAAARLVVDGEETPAFTLCTRPAPRAVGGRAAQLRAANRAAHRRAEPEAPPSALAGKALPAASTADASYPEPPGPDVGVREPGGLRPDDHGSLHGALPPDLEPSRGATCPRQGASEGSVASADWRG